MSGKFPCIMLGVVAFLFVLQGCKKDFTEPGPINFTDGKGNLFIPIDTATGSFYAYSQSDLISGRLAGVFNDTVFSAFRLSLVSKPYWDSIYHPGDTTVFPDFFPAHTMVFATDVNLTGFSSPYHFLLLGLTGDAFRGQSSGKPSVRLTIQTF